MGDAVYNHAVHCVRCLWLYGKFGRLQLASFKCRFVSPLLFLFQSFGPTTNPIITLNLPAGTCPVVCFLRVGFEIELFHYRVITFSLEEETHGRIAFPV